VIVNMMVVWAFIGSLCAGMLFNISKKNLFWSGLAGTLGWLMFAGVYEVIPNKVLATFFGAAGVGVFSELMARIRKSPATVFSVPGIFAIVPGIAAYQTVQYVVDNQMEKAAISAVETMASAGAIAFGILLVTSVFRFAARLKEKWDHDR